MNKLNEYVIRSVLLNDLSKIMKLEKLCFKGSVVESKETILERISYFSDGFLVTTNDKDITGYISSEIWNIKNEIAKSNFELNHKISEKHDLNGNTLYISSFAINPNYQGKGIGKLLFNSLYEKIKENYPSINNSVLVVSENWIPAKNLYEKQGFYEILKLSNFFNPTPNQYETGIVMKKNL